MKEYKLKLGAYHGFDEITVQIPNEIKFFCDPNEIGGIRSKNSMHYTTIVKTSDYTEWIEKISHALHVDTFELGDYTIITPMSVSNDTPLPTIDKDEWFRQNDIDLTRYVFVFLNRNYDIQEAVRIKKFNSIWNIKGSAISFKNEFFLYDNYFSIHDKSINSHLFNKCRLEVCKLTLITLKDTERDILWNSMIKQVLNNSVFNEEFINNDYDFNKWKDKIEIKTNISLDELRGKIEHYETKKLYN